MDDLFVEKEEINISSIDKELERMERGNKRNCDNNIQHIRN